LASLSGNWRTVGNDSPIGCIPETMKSLIMVLAALTSAVAANAQLMPVSARPAPAISAEQWWNAPQGLNLGHGKVTIVHFWTFGCINCQHNQPVYQRWVDQYRGTNVQIIGIHTPETPAEKRISNVEAYLKRENIRYPVAFDLTGSNWRRWQNQYWPSVYLVDKQGRIRYVWEGELRWNNIQGDLEIEKRVKELLSQP
jgi:thiol-disulfide isomerase/thioredoxin